MSTHRATCIAAIGFLLGVYLGEVSSFATELCGVMLVISLLQSASLVYEKWSRHRRQYSTTSSISRFASVTLVVSLSVAFGIIRVQFLQSADTLLCDHGCGLEGEVSSFPKVEGSAQSFVFRPRHESKTQDILVKTQLYPEYHRGDILKVNGIIREVAGSDKSSHDYRRYLTLHSIGSVAYYPHIEMLAKGGEYYGVRLHAFAHDAISRYLPPEQAALSMGMLFGESSLSRDTGDALRVAGISHIVVLSGFNIVILISAVLAAVRFLPLTIRILTAGCVVAFFLSSVTLEASIVRAALMASLAILALYLGRGYVARQALLLSFLAIGLYNPTYILYDVSLHLSFLATAGIVYGVPLLGSYFKHGTAFVRELTFTTLAAYIATLPYSVYVFGSVSIYAPFANILVVPFVPVCMLLSGLLVIVSPIPFISEILGYITYGVSSYILGVAHLVALLPHATYSMSISLLGMVSVYVTGLVVVAVWSSLESRKAVHETVQTKQEELISDIIPF